MSKKVRITYVTGGRRPHTDAPTTELPRWALSNMREGIDYILGTHEDWSEEARALLAAHRLAESAG